MSSGYKIFFAFLFREAACDTHICHEMQHDYILYQN